MGSDAKNTGKLRSLHVTFGLASAPMIIITATCGGLLLLRKTGLYERKGAFRDFLQSMHSYELILPYVGLVACGLMLAVAITGLLLVLCHHRSSPTGSTERA